MMKMLPFFLLPEVVGLLACSPVRSSDTQLLFRGSVALGHEVIRAVRFVLETPGLKLKALIIISIIEPFSLLQSGMPLMLQAYTAQQPAPGKLAFDTSKATKGRKGTRSPRMHSGLSQHS